MQTTHGHAAKASDVWVVSRLFGSTVKRAPNIRIRWRPPMIEGIHSAIEECRDRIGQELTLRKLEDRVSKPAGPSTSPSSPSERGPWPDRLAAMLERDCATAQSTETCSPFVMVSHGD